MADRKSFISSLNMPFNEEHDDFFPLYQTPKLNKDPYRGNNATGAYYFSRKHIDCCQRRNTIIQSDWHNVYSCRSFNQIWILKCWIFWIILIIVLFQKCLLSKQVTFLHLANYLSWECIATFKIIINSAIVFRMVRNVTN